MRRRSRLAVTFVALLTVGWSVVTTQPSGSALAADPRPNWPKPAHSSQTPSRRSSRWRLPSSASAPSSPSSSASLPISTASSTSPQAELDGRHGRVRPRQLGSSTRFACRLPTSRRAPRRAYASRSRPSIPSSSRWPPTSSGAPTSSGSARPSSRTILRSAYERSQTSLLEVLLSADSLDQATTQVGYLMTVSDQDTGPRRGHPRHPPGARDSPRDAPKDGRQRARRCAHRGARPGGVAQAPPRRADRPRGPAGRAPRCGRRESGPIRNRRSTRRSRRRAASSSRSPRTRARRRRPPAPRQPATAAGLRAAGRHRGGPGAAPPRRLACGRAAAAAQAAARRHSLRLPLAGALVPGDPGVGTDRLRPRAAVHLQRHVLPALPRRDRLRRRLRHADLATGAGVVVASVSRYAVGPGLRRGRRPRRRHPDLVLAHAAARHRAARAIVTSNDR